MYKAPMIEPTAREQQEATSGAEQLTYAVRMRLLDRNAERLPSEALDIILTEASRLIATLLAQERERAARLVEGYNVPHCGQIAYAIREGG